ncbi:MAG: protein kinase [Myxococcales bacterium]|jgi:serine/threonine protein kinase|nr:protein kinase [Myxococcales bacterium]
MADQRIGNYRIVRKLGEGGMGVVFEAIHELINRRAAIKVLHADFSRNPEMATRFLNEARAANIVQHPGIVNIFEFDRLPDGSAYIVMDYLDGDSLTQRLQRHGGRMEVGVALSLILQVSEALTAAHAKGVIHRDLKPDNIMIVPDQGDASRELVKILDFGIAKMAESQGMGPSLAKTQVGVPMGTPLYMAPEQWKGASEVEDKADVYSLGVIIYEMLSGQPPFIANSGSEVMALHILATPRQLNELAPNVPIEVVELVHQMLSKVPADRPSIAMVTRELRRILGINTEMSIPGQPIPIGSNPGMPSGPMRTTQRPPGLRTSQIGVRQTGTGAQGPLQSGGNASLAGTSLRRSLAGLGVQPQPGAASDPAQDPAGNSQNAMQNPAPAQSPKWQKFALIGVIGLVVAAGGALAVKLTGSPPPDVKPEGGAATSTPKEAGLGAGKFWADVPSGTTQVLQDLWGTGPSSLWAVGKNGTLLRWNGTTWATAELPASASKSYLNAIWGSSAEDIWVVGKEGMILHWDGNKWNEIPSGAKETLKKVWGLAKDNAWAVGENGVILHWNGNDWSPTPSGMDTELRGIWGSAANDIWAVGGSDASDGIILRWDGTKWATYGHVEARLNSLWGHSAKDIWAVGGRPGPEGTVHHWNGTAWVQERIPRVPWLNAIWGTSPHDIWVIGDSGAILHFNGSQWAESISGTTETFKSVFGSGPNDVWTVGFKGVIRHFSGKTWSVVPVAAITQSLDHVFGSSQNDVWGVGKAGTIVHWDGKAWNTVPSGTTSDLHGVSGSGPSNMWVCGDKGTLLHYTGTAWEPVQSGSAGNLNAMFALDAQDIWAVGEKGSALHYDGKSWTATPTTVESNLHALFGFDRKDIWAGGDQSTIIHYTGSAWAKATYDVPQPPRTIHTMFGSRPDSLWAGGQKGLILYYNGKTWASSPSGTSEDINAIFGNGPFDVWGVGSGGVILHWSGGTSWSKVLSPTKKTLSGVWSSRPGDMWAVGQFGLILH